MAVSKIRFSVREDTDVTVRNKWNGSVLVLINNTDISSGGLASGGTIDSISVTTSDIVEINDSTDPGNVFNNWLNNANPFLEVVDYYDIDIIEFPDISAFAKTNSSGLYLPNYSFRGMFKNLNIYSVPSNFFTGTENINTIQSQVFQDTFSNSTSSRTQSSLTFPPNSLKFDNLKTASGSSFAQMFYRSQPLNISSGFNFPNLQSMGTQSFANAFYGSLITSLPIGSFSFPKLTYSQATVFNSMFAESSIERIPDNAFTFDLLANVPAAFGQQMIIKCPNLVSLGEGSFRFPSASTIAYYFFHSFLWNCPGVTRLPAGSFDVSSATATGEIFSAFGINSGLQLGNDVTIKNISTNSSTTVYYNDNGVNTARVLQSGESISYKASEQPQIITITSSQTGDINIRNMWDSPIYINDVLYQSHGGDQEHYNDHYTVSISPSSPIVIKESSPGSTFKQWCISNRGFITAATGSNVTEVQVSQMPTMDKFINGTTSPSYAFQCFNKNGLITQFPTGTFDTFDITNLGSYSFSYFNSGGKLTSLPVGSFNTSSVVSAGTAVFSNFNSSSNTMSLLPSGSFNFASLEYTGLDFCSAFNYHGGLLHLPENSFKFDSLLEVGGYFCAYFNQFGSLTALPYGSFNISSLTTYGINVYSGFNATLGGLTRSTTSGVAIKNFTNYDIVFHYRTQNGTSSETVVPGDSFEYYTSEYNPQPPTMKVYVGSSRVTDIYVGADKVTDFFA